MDLSATDDLTIAAVESGLVTWDDLLRSVQAFQYGRNSNRADLSLVWTERKGTCSSKHAFLKLMADLNNIEDVELVLCIYSMTSKNTSGVGSILDRYDLDRIPEAHCYLKINGKELDLTSLSADFQRIANDILETRIIEPKDVVSEKVKLHRAYMEGWIEEHDIQFSLDELWSIREECIAAISHG